MFRAVAATSGKLNLNKLNARQKEAVLFGDGPLLILAGAGSGKTSTMTYRIAHLITERGVRPSEILGLSFTNKAARELKERVQTIVGKASGPKSAQGAQKPLISTFHSLCVRLLREHAEVLGFQKNFTILDTNDQSDVLRGILKNIKVDDRKFDPHWLLFQFGQFKNKFLSALEAETYFLEKLETGKMHADYAVVAASAFPKYQAHLKALNSLDFDDLIYQTVRLLTDFQDVREQTSDRFKQILVDEYQDTNPAQFQILQLLTQTRQNLCVVGDDDQSIYSWRGADPAHILQFKHHYPAAKIITLDQNYRSTSTILEAANQVIAKNTLRHPKILWSQKGEGQKIGIMISQDDRSESEGVADQIREHAVLFESGVNRQIRPWKDFAVLYRSNAQSRLFEEALRMRQIPYQIVGGMSFLDRKEIKDVLSYWRLIVNPKDDAACRRVINWPSRGIGKTSLEALNQHALKSEKSLLETLAHASAIAPRTTTGATNFLEALERLREELRGIGADPVQISKWAHRSLEHLQIKKAVEEDCETPADFSKRWENIEELAHGLGQLPLRELLENEPHATGADLLREYLSRLTLQAQDENDKETDLEKDRVTLLTLHGAKGLEFPIVFLVGTEEGMLPHQRSIDEGTDLSEERRLCYVGITRAKDILYLSRAKTRIRWGKIVPRTPSRFLDEIPAHLTETQDESAPVDLSDNAKVEKHETMVKGFLDRMRERIK